MNESNILSSKFNHLFLANHKAYKVEHENTYTDINENNSHDSHIWSTDESSDLSDDRQIT